MAERGWRALIGGASIGGMGGRPDRRLARLRRAGAAVWAALRDELLAWVYPWPPYCLGCGRYLPGWPPAAPALCEECAARLGHGPGSRCPVCDRPAWLARPGDACSQCRNLGPPWVAVRSVGVYGGLLRRLILRMKYGDEPYLAELLGRAMAGRAAAWPPALLVVPVPMHPERLRQRGYNQAALLARAVARASRRALAEGLLVRREPGGAQAALGAAGRRANVAGAFVPAPRVRPGALSGQPVLLVDDVLTTGRTLAAACAALRQAGAGAIYGLTAAVTPLDPGRLAGPEPGLLGTGLPPAATEPRMPFTIGGHGL